MYSRQIPEQSRRLLSFRKGISDHVNCDSVGPEFSVVCRSNCGFQTIYLRYEDDSVLAMLKCSDKWLIIKTTNT